jgi:hypothetical protein
MVTSHVLAVLNDGSDFTSIVPEYTDPQLQKEVSGHPYTPSLWRFSPVLLLGKMPNKRNPCKTRNAHTGQNYCRLSMEVCFSIPRKSQSSKYHEIPNKKTQNAEEMPVPVTL